MENLLTPAQVRQAFIEDGVTVTEWAAKHGYSRQAVYAALNGRARGLRGEAHRVAVALGLRPAPSGRTEALPGARSHARGSPGHSHPDQHPKETPMT